MTDRSSPVSARVEEAIHYLSAIKVRLELLYEHSTQDHRLLEQLSDEVDWVDAEIDRLRSAGHAQRSAVQEAATALIEQYGFGAGHCLGVMSDGKACFKGSFLAKLEAIKAALSDTSTDGDGK